MTETFTKLNKKFSQPQQKEIGKKNTPRRKAKFGQGEEEHEKNEIINHPGKSYKLKKKANIENISKNINGNRTKRKSEDSSKLPKI